MVVFPNLCVHLISRVEGLLSTTHCIVAFRIPSYTVTSRVVTSGGTGKTRYNSNLKYVFFIYKEALAWLLILHIVNCNWRFCLLLFFLKSIYFKYNFWNILKQKFVCLIYRDSTGMLFKNTLRLPFLFEVHYQLLLIRNTYI